jgi:iron complex outermembrane receptor protein
MFVHTESAMVRTRCCKSFRNCYRLAQTVSAALLWACFGLGPAWAEQPHKNLADMTLEELLGVEVYSASKHLQKAGAAPSSVTVFTADEIRAYGYRTLADILRSVRSFYVTYDRNYSYVGVRGLGRPGDYNSRILLLIDGHRFNDNVYDQAMIGTEFPLDVDLIERVEIIRGPASSLYGANAFFGVLNVITRKARNVKAWEFSSEAASFGTYTGRVTYGGELRGFRVLASGSFLGSQGHERLYYPEFNSASTNYGYALDRDDDQLGSGLVTVEYRDFTFQSLYGNRDKAIPTAAYGTIFNAAGTRTVDTHSYFDLGYQHTFAGAWSVRARTSYDRYTYKGTYPLANADGEVNPNFDSAEGEWWGSEAQLSRVLPIRNLITAGGEYRDNLRQDQSNYDTRPFRVYVDDRRSSFSGGLFLQDEWTITPKLTLNAGLRYDYYNCLHSSTNPRAGLIYQPGKQSVFKLLYGTAFRIPNAYELYYWAPGSTPALMLHPEKIKTLELVWEQGISAGVSVSSSVYHNRINNLISQQKLADGTSIYANLDKAHSTGLELELNGKLPSQLEGKLSYGLQRTIDPSSGAWLTNSPEHLLKLNVAFPLFTPHLSAGVDGQYSSRSLTLAGTSVAGRPTVNVTLLGRDLGHHADLSASVYNLLDQRRFDPGAAEHRQSAIEQDGRSFRVKLTWTWGGPH